MTRCAISFSFFLSVSFLPFFSFFFFFFLPVHTIPLLLSIPVHRGLVFRRNRFTLSCLLFLSVSPLSRFPSSVSRVPTHRARHSFTLAFCFFDSSGSLDITNSRMGSSSLCLRFNDFENTHDGPLSISFQTKIQQIQIKCVLMMCNNNVIGKIGRSVISTENVILKIIKVSRIILICEY